jgi:hypothetical protein
MDTQRRLDDILGRDIGLQWFEAIALVQSVCEQVLAHRPSDAFPSAADVVVSADGSIAVLGYGVGPAVTAAGYLLAGIVGDDVPVRLRLAIAEANASQSAYPHLAAFSEALSYFERPGRRELVASIYAKAAAAPSRSVALPQQAPAREADRATQKQQLASPRRRLPVAWLLLGAAVVAASVWVIPNHRQLPGALSGLVADARQEESPAPVNTIQVAATQARRAPKQIKGRTREETATPAPAMIPLESGPNPRNSAPILVFQRVEILASVLGDVVAASGSEMRPRVYSRDDGFVSPPRAVRPQLPSEPPFDSAIDPPTELELVIGATGVVETAKLRSPPRNITEFMLVSAAKAWVFQPAELDGRPVKYRHRVRLILP